MAVDMSRLQRSVLQDAIEQAQKLDGGDTNVAAEAWDIAADKADYYARSARTKDDRKRRSQSAASFRERAAKLRNAKNNIATTGGEVVADANDGFRAAARQLIHKSSITFDQIAGQKDVINEICTAVAFTQAIPPQGVGGSSLENILLSGPAGCGKTILAAAVSNGLDGTFFSVKVSDLLSKFYGDSPRILKALYEEAGSHDFAVVFIDEIDALAMSRSAGDSSADRRLLTSFLTELDGMNQKGQPGNVITIAATNRPWDLDQAILSRFGRQIYAGLPDDEARTQLMKLEVIDQGYEAAITNEEWLQETEGLSGREIAALCRQMIRRMLQDANPEILTHARSGREALQAYQTQSLPLSNSHLKAIRSGLKPQTTSATLEAFQRWNTHN